jgi:hypothetical protein
MKNKIKYIMSIIMCAGFLTACGDYDFIVENQCKLTGHHEVRQVDSSYFLDFGYGPVLIPDTSNETYYEYSRIDNNTFWSRAQVIINPTED